jgi:hypothetical protein
MPGFGKPCDEPSAGYPDCHLQHQVIGLAAAEEYRHSPKSWVPAQEMRYPARCSLRDIIVIRLDTSSSQRPKRLRLALPLLAACALAVAATGSTLAQSAEDFSYLVPMPNNMKSLDSYGNVCLNKFDRFAQQLPSASTIQFEQSVTVHNRCLKQIFVEICYEGQKRCKQARIPAMGKAVVVLGIDKINYFKFNYQEMKSPF